jgi:hypothetical protein
MERYHAVQFNVAARSKRRAASDGRARHQLVVQYQPIDSL